MIDINAEPQKYPEESLPARPAETILSARSPIFRRHVSTKRALRLMRSRMKRMPQEKPLPPGTVLPKELDEPPKDF